MSVLASCKQRYPSLTEDEWEVLEEDMWRVPIKHRSMVWDAILNARPTAVDDVYFYVQRWFFVNVFKWPVTPRRYEEKTVPCKDFPLSWVGSDCNRPLIAGWREKLDGIPYSRNGGVWEGDEQLVLPSNLSFIEYFERIGNDCYILKPYTKLPEFVSGVRFGTLTFFSHPWRRDSVYTDGEGIVLLMTDRNEYRVKCVPTTEIIMDGLVMEVQLDYDFSDTPRPYLSPVAPRAGKSPKTELDALTYLATQVSFGMVAWKVEAEFEMVAPDLSALQVRGKGDQVTISVEGKLEIGYNNVARIPTSAKALIQTSDGKILLVKEGKKGWDLPGGKADFLDEVPSAIIRREVLEELGALLPNMEWKKVRRADRSVAFLYHVIVPLSFCKVGDTVKWFTIPEIERLTVGSTVPWFVELLQEALEPGQPHLLIPKNELYHVLVLARAGDTCYNPTTVSGQCVYDVLGRQVAQGKYVHPVVPITAQVPKYGFDTSMVPVGSTNVSERSRDLFFRANGVRFANLSSHVIDFVKARFVSSFIWQAHKGRISSLWHRPNSFDRLIFWYCLQDDTYGVSVPDLLRGELKGMWSEYCQGRGKGLVKGSVLIIYHKKSVSVYPMD